MSYPSSSRPRWLAAAAALVAALPAVLSAQAVSGAAKPSGAQLFGQRCASCHGAKGEGTKKYQKPLAGSRTEKDLAAFIGKSMPPPPARKLPAAEAQSVAAFMYDAFYSPVAQARNRPARVELSRLTVRQYRSAAADLVGSFRILQLPAGGTWDEKRGLRGQYYKGRRNRGGGGERVLDRLDPEVKFDFGATAPAEQLDPYQFSILWEGAVVPPETGEYEFIVRTDQACRLWVNDPNKAVIDAYVKSGSDKEYRAAVHLLGGRAYPLKLEFLKAQQGVNNQERLRAKPPENAFISLEWKAPKRAPEVIPQRCLLPGTFPEVFVLTAPFPPDDRSMGYERGTSVSKEWDQATTEAAMETTAYVVANLRELSGIADAAADRTDRLKAFCRQLVERAFRRPLSPELDQVFVERQFQKAADADLAVKRVLLLTLKSPRFLFREMGSGAADQYDTASRLSFGLWDSIPDQELLKAAAAGELATREQVLKQAERMVSDPRTRSKVRDFFLQWLKVDGHPDLTKDPKRYPEFNEAAASDLRTSLELFLDEVVWSEKSDFRELFLTDRMLLNGRLAKIYGAQLPGDASFQAVAAEGGERAGVLTHPYMMASLAYVESSSPIHRGVLIARNMLGRVLQPPQEAFTPLPAELHPKLTTRERVALQTKPAACGGCHSMINPLGFTLEKFDAIGRLRTNENGKPLDTTGGYQPVNGKPVRFNGVRDLATYLAGSEEAHGAFVEKLFQYLVKQPIRAFGPKAAPDLEHSFAANGFSIRKQVVESVTTAALKR